MRRVAITDGNGRAGHQEAVDYGHQAAEQGEGGCSPKGGSFGHRGFPVFRSAVGRRIVDFSTKYVYQMPEAIRLFA